MFLSAGLPIWFPGTDPAHPFLLWPAMPRRLARPTCTAGSSPSSTPSLLMTCGRRMSTCVSTLPWKWVSRYKSLSGCTMNTSVWVGSHLFLQNKNIFFSVELWVSAAQELVCSVLLSRQSQRLLQGGWCCHRLNRLASWLRLHQHHACDSGALNR